MRKLLLVMLLCALGCASEVKPQPPKPAETKVEPQKEEAPKTVEKPEPPKEEKPEPKKKSKKKSKKRR